MDSKTLTEIDFYTIQKEISNYCITEEGVKSFLADEPSVDSKKIEFLKNCSRQWQSILSAKHKSLFSSWNPIKNLFPIIKTSGAALQLEQVHALGQFCISVKKVKEVLKNCEVDLKIQNLCEEAQKIPDLAETEKLIFRIITADGEIRDLPEISAIRKEIANLNSKIKNIMKQYTSDSKLANVLESNVPVLRNGRQVLAVKASQQNKVSGIVHEVSNTAHTVYIEPEEAVRCSNELIQKENELIEVIKRILQELTQALQPSIPLLKQALPIMILFDKTLASAKWGNEHNCCFAQSCLVNDKSKENKNESPMLLQAKHPLLGDKAVPIDIRFLPEKRILIITGPNTGGKTVTLKTFALFAMLNQCGFPLPCAEGTRLPVFSNVFADIGDGQSLDQSLSTFSGHMKNIANAVQKAKDDSLILLDELGSGTDPQEGTAISMAVLDKLIEKRAFVLVTTHQGILKNYGYSKEGCVNASVEFNQNTLSPSYKLLMGVPGESHALDIAQRSGLPVEICKKARSYVVSEQADVSSLIKGLNKKHRELDRLHSEYKNKLSEIEQKYEKTRQKELDLRKKENDLKVGKLQEMNDFLIHSRRQLENLVRTLKEGEITREKTLGVKQFINEIEEKTERIDKKVEKEEMELSEEIQHFQKEMKEKSVPKVQKTKKRMKNSEAFENATVFDSDSTPKVVANADLKFEVGAVVVSKKGNNEGILVDRKGSDSWFVQFGSLKMIIKEKDLVLVQKKSTSFVPSVSVDFDISSDAVVSKTNERPVFELRLLGLYSDDAVKALEHQIDLCVIHNFPQFSVIHGKGNGVLQQVVQDYLSNCPSVKEFNYAPAEDGGAGKTYVVLKM